MTDEQINRLCAEAMGWHTGRLASKVVAYAVNDCAIIAGNDSGGESVYDPLHDDAQAMALVKRFKLECYCETEQDDLWIVAPSTVLLSHLGHDAQNTDLNRAICECVANMQQAK